MARTRVRAGDAESVKAPPEPPDALGPVLERLIDACASNPGVSAAIERLQLTLEIRTSPTPAAAMHCRISTAQKGDIAAIGDALGLWPSSIDIARDVMKWTWDRANGENAG